MESSNICFCDWLIHSAVCSGSLLQCGSEFQAKKHYSVWPRRTVTVRGSSVDSVIWHSLRSLLFLLLFVRPHSGTLYLSCGILCVTTCLAHLSRGGHQVVSIMSVSLL